jgi:hypothetical protein
VAVAFDDCRVDHGERQVWITQYGIENPFENAGLHPIAIPLEHRISVAKRRRQIPPLTARAGNPQYLFKKHAVTHFHYGRDRWTYLSKAAPS